MRTCFFFWLTCEVKGHRMRAFTISNQISLYVLSHWLILARNSLCFVKIWMKIFRFVICSLSVVYTVVYSELLISFPKTNNNQMCCSVCLSHEQHREHFLKIPKGSTIKGLVSFFHNLLFLHGGIERKKDCSYSGNLPRGRKVEGFLSFFCWELLYCNLI